MYNTGLAKLNQEGKEGKNIFDVDTEVGIESKNLARNWK